MLGGRNLLFSELALCWEVGNNRMKYELTESVEVHSSDEGDKECNAHNGLTCKHFPRHHWEFCAFPFPENPCCDQSNANKKRAEHISAGPRVTKSACLKSHDTIVFNVSLDPPLNRIEDAREGLQESQAYNRKCGAEVVNFLCNPCSRFSSHAKL